MQAQLLLFLVRNALTDLPQTPRYINNNKIALLGTHSILASPLGHCQLRELATRVKEA